MKAFIISKPFSSGVYDVDIPVPAEDEVLVKVAAAGFCGTDIHTYKGEHITDYPIIPGHEFAGTVAAVGRKVTQFKPGDPVICDPNIFCENCFFCKQNKQIHCEHIQVIGNTRNGAFAEYVTAPERCTFAADGIDLLLGSMAEPLSCVINAHNKLDIPVGASVLIVGAGTIGLMHLLICKRRGASQVSISDLKPAALSTAASLGADYTYLSTPDMNEQVRRDHPRGFDIIIDASGAPKAIESTIPLLAETGSYVFFGACATNSEIKVNPFDIYYHDWKLIGSYALQKTMPQSIAAIRSGLDLKPLIGQVITIDEMPKVFDDFVNGQTSGKVIVKFD